jgi:two-component sensor histidine kinase
MTNKPDEVEQVEDLLDTPDLAGALESEQFKKFLDHVPLAIAVSELSNPEIIIYANPEFEELSGIPAVVLERHYWDILSGRVIAEPDDATLVSAIVEGQDCIGTYKLKRSDAEPSVVDIHSNVIENDEGVPSYRLVALVSPRNPSATETERLEERVREKDTLLLELQHRVKNNLQMITALIRLETRNAAAGETGKFERLAGRVGSLAILYDALSLEGAKERVDLGAYLGQIATSVMAAHAVDGIRLDLMADTYMVSINVAMPTGLVVNELLINALKHAFSGRESGTIKVHCLVENDRCTITIADDGVGLPDGETWPRRGKLGALIAQSLRENAGAELKVTSSNEMGTTVTISFEGPGLVENRD